ncbi:MAG: DUF2239 family protein [Caulobacter sp.]|nr:DUF2239 family protein [Caulobacter sp.]
MHDVSTLVTAFSGDHRLTSGPLAQVARVVAVSADPSEVLVFRDDDGRSLDLDLRGTPEDVVGRLAPPPQTAPRGPGRPKLGVTAREVTLLPRHWDWLSRQPGGASVALRKLVESALRDPAEEGRTAREAAYRFLTTMAGDRPGYEEVTRALFAGDVDAFRARMSDWPADVRDHALTLARAP